MRKRLFRKNRILCFGISLVLLLSSVWAHPVGAGVSADPLGEEEEKATDETAGDEASGDETGDDGSTYDSDAFSVREEYESEKYAASAYRHTAEILLEEIQKVNEQMAEQAAGIEEANQEIVRIDEEIAANEEAIIQAEADLEEEKQYFAQVLKFVYESKESEDEFSFIMGADDTMDIVNRSEYTSCFSGYINDIILKMQTSKNDITSKGYELSDLRADRETELKAYESGMQSLTDEINELSGLMEEAEAKADDAEELAEELRLQVAILEAQEKSVLEGKSYDGSMSNVEYDGDGTDYYYVGEYPYTDEELTLLAGIIECEAGSVSYPGMIAVGSVVMNRVASPNFANTIEGVIYAPYQFEPVSVGTYAVVLARGPAASCYAAAREVLEGKRNVPNFYFKAAWYAEAHGISGVNIGGNVFH